MAFGARVDARCARRAAGVLTLSEGAAAALRPHARGPLERIAPGLAPEPPPPEGAVFEACRRRGLAPGHYGVYAGNLDPYQDLALLDAAAARVPELPLVAVTHDPDPPRLRALRVVRAPDPEEARALVFGARLALLPRRSAGGFPIKLLGYLEAGLPVVAFARVADTLVHGESGWLLAEGAGSAAFAEAVAALWKDDERRARLAAGARAALVTAHAWPALAARTLALAERARAGE